MATSPASRITPGATVAHLALSILWCADRRAPEVFEMPRYVIGEDGPALSADAAAHWLETQAKPLWLTGQLNGSGALLLTAAPPPSVSSTQQQPRQVGRADWLEKAARLIGAHRLLLLAADEVWRVSLASVETLAREYWFSPAPSMVGGGPSRDPWVEALQLPEAWLRDTDAVFGVGHSFRIGSGWERARLRTI